MPRRPLQSLERIARSYGGQAAGRKRELLGALRRRRLASPGELLRLHELLNFLDAYPDDARVHATVRRLLGEFRRRPELRRHRAALAASGIAGTDTPFRFFWPTADWLAQRWPRHLRLDRDDGEAEAALQGVLPRLLPPVQAAWFATHAPEAYAALGTLAPRGRTDAGFLLELIRRLPGDDFAREALGDALDLSYVLVAGTGTPQRTTSRASRPKVYFQRTSLRRARPDLRQEVRRPPAAVRRLGKRAGTALVDLARVSMVTRERDLAAFQFADSGDVFLSDDGEGLAFAWMGLQPARRELLRATYGALTLKNGVPAGYVQADVLGRHAEISFNTFPAFRGAEAAWIFARLLASVHANFGCDEFSIEPYQLGDHNEEGIESGAWWFYYKFGFRPRHATARRLVAREFARLADRPGRRSSPAVLRALARWHLYFHLEPGRQARLPRARRWLAAAAVATRRYPGDAAEREATAWLGLGRRTGWRAAERLALRRWAPLLLALRRRRWSQAERRALAGLVRAKGGRSETEFLRRLQALPRVLALLD